MYEYEDISNIDRIACVSSATKIIEKGWERRNYPLVRLDDEIPWELKKQDQRSWNFYIHCWDMVDSLLKAYSQTLEVCFLSPAIRIAESWATQHKDQSNNELSPFTWYDMAVGLRAYRLAYIIESGVQAGLINKPMHKMLWNTLEQHQAYLADDTNIAFHNNHGYYQVVGQLAMGRRFATESPLMAHALEQGKVRLKRMLSQQFTADGIHREHSPDYHRMVYDTLRAMINAKLVEDTETITFSEKIEKALSWFILPNQHIANFGDSDYRLLRRNVAKTEKKWQTPEMRYGVSGGQVGQLPTETIAVFPEGGYFVVRKPGEIAPKDFSKSSYLAQIAAFHSRTHKHADDLSFIWSDRGSDILVDAGRYGYIGKAEQGSDLWLDGHWYADPNRVYCESTRAHNTLEFDGKNYLRKGAKPYGSALKRWREDASGLIAVETECKHFNSIRRARMLVFMPGKWLVVFDWFHDNAKSTHNVKQWFHLAPELEVLLDQGSYVIPVSTSTQPLYAVSLLSGVFASRPYLAEKIPAMQGWWSAKERDIVPAYAFCFEQSNAVNGSFATLFSFSNSLTADISWSKVSISGRKAQFRWTDETGRHVLRIERPEVGEIILSYVCGN